MNEDLIAEKIVKGEVDWEGALRLLLSQLGMDPWDIDIASLCDSFLKLVERLPTDMRLYGKFILVASILLRLKAESMELYEKIEELPLLLFERRELIQLPSAEVKRRITLDELIRAIKKAMKVKRKRRKVYAMPTIKYEFQPKDIIKLMEKIYNRVKEMLKRRKEVPFSKLLISKDREDVVWTFIPLIHLSNKGMVLLRQERPFDEIYVSIG